MEPNTTTINGLRVSTTGLRECIERVAELERLRPRTRLIEKPYSLVLLVETLEEMLSSDSGAGSPSQNLHS